jgi:hypothetical protein
VKGTGWKGIVTCAAAAVRAVTNSTAPTRSARDEARSPANAPNSVGTASALEASRLDMGRIL